MGRGCGRQVMVRIGVALAAVAAAVAAGATSAGAAPMPSAGCAGGAIEHGRRLTRTIDVGGVARAYVLDVPDRVSATTPVPVLFDFHGFGHSGARVWEVSAFRSLAEREGFITVYPEGLPVRLRIKGEDLERPGWEMFAADGNRDLTFVARLLDDLERRYCIDRARVYATGFSNGAFFSQLLGCALPDRFAAVAPVSGGPLRVPCRPSRGVPILIQHGRQDDLIDVAQARAARDAWVAIDGCTAKPERSADGCERYTRCRDGSAVEYCEGDYAHRWPVEATPRVWEFLKRFALGK